MDQWLNSRRNCPYYKLSNKAAIDLVNEFLGAYEAYRKGRGLSEGERDTFRAHIVKLLLDLLAAFEGDPTRWIGYSRSHSYFIRGGGYWDHKNDRSILSERVFFQLIEYMEAEGFIENNVAKAGYGGYSSRMRATPKLGEIFRERNLNWTSIAYDPDSPVIIVKDNNKKPIPHPSSDSFDIDSAEANLHRINSNLQLTYINLHVDDTDHEEIRVRMRGDDNEEQEPKEPFEFSNRFLRRIFAEGKFESGGRFYGGWWQGIPSEYRKHIVIDGAVTREMDYSSMQPRLMYARVGEKPPQDAYALEGWHVDIRPFAKKAFSQLINSDKTSRHENQWHRFAPKIELSEVPVNWHDLNVHQRNPYLLDRFEEVFNRPYTDLLRGLLNMHRPIDQFFFSGIWGHMQRMDSDIAERVMIKLLDMPVPVTALPVHDSFIVRRGAEWDLLYAMNDAFEELVGAPCDISLEEAVYDPPAGYVHTGPILMADIIEDTMKIMTERKKANTREVQWQRAFGPVDV